MVGCLVGWPLKMLETILDVFMVEFRRFCSVVKLSGFEVERIDVKYVIAFFLGVPVILLVVVELSGFEMPKSVGILLIFIDHLK